jgi:hypothetical protein
MAGFVGRLGSAGKVTSMWDWRRAFLSATAVFCEHECMEHAEAFGRIVSFSLHRIEGTENEHRTYIAIHTPDIAMLWVT